ncbi:MAG: bifunctional molybdenum cofactor biosynthesis protein MoaC/MoaB [Candidatus Melainabacteria bacterium]|nr:bifunctional molybdenum cofactor biosynthesis protein MoaC/MoaB [Candidatus Melainabacteria bacterium]
MINIDHKFNTLRKAIAEGRIETSPQTIEMVKAGTVPKGNVLEIARAGAIAAAKKTPETIVLCHPIPIDYCNISYEIGDNYILVRAELHAIAKTGVEMEAMNAAYGALINLYDTLKPVDENLTIKELKLSSKKGGKTDFKDNYERKLKAAIIVISDSTFAGTRKDKSGLVIKEFLEHEALVDIQAYEIIPDDIEQIQSKVLELEARGYDLIISTGGTGLGPKDFTPEAIKPLLDKEIPGITEAIRRHGKDRTPYAMLSREIAGLKNQSIIITLPGSSRGAKESMQAIFPGLTHAFPMIWGGGHDHHGKAKLEKELSKV